MNQFDVEYLFLIHKPRHEELIKIAEQERKIQKLRKKPSVFLFSFYNMFAWIQVRFLPEVKQNQPTRKLDVLPGPCCSTEA